MNISNDVDGLKSLLGISQTASATASPIKSQPGHAAEATGDQATVSSVGAGVSQTASDSDIRQDKVVAVQQAMATGTYNVPASAVASKVVDSLLNNGAESSK